MYVIRHTDLIIYHTLFSSFVPELETPSIQYHSHTFLSMVYPTVWLYTYCFIQFLFKSVERRKKKFIFILSFIIT